MTIAQKAASGPPAEMPGKIALFDIHSAIVHRGLALWRGLKGTRRLPTRAEIQPRALGDLMRHTALVRLDAGGANFEVRLVGDAIVQAQGISYRGYSAAMIDKQSPSYGGELRKIFQSIHAAPEPLVFRGWYERTPGPKPVYHETMFLPLGEGAVDHILVVAAYAMSRDEKLR
ncbi:MAG TPA: PAS domain-containing protein [Rhizomicrobium sp.]|jgi:hypothetical protein